MKREATEFRVTQFNRKPFPGAFSIERLFECLRPKIARQCSELTFCEAPFHSKGILKRLRNICWARKHQNQINHVTGDIHYICLGLPGRRTLLTIHDLQMLERLRGLPRRLVKLFWFDLPVKHVGLISVISEATKRELIRQTGTREDKILVIPNAVGQTFQPAPREFQQECPQILHIGTKANKNLERLILAIRGMRCRLHIIGKLNEPQKKLLDEFEVEFSNCWNITNQEIFQSYCQCDLLAFVSTHEGFGLPILEAQQVERPIVTSNCSSMPEVAGKGACLVDPFNVQSIRAGIQRVISDAAYRQRLLEAGRENRMRFSRSAVAEKYIDAYRKLLA